MEREAERRAEERVSGGDGRRREAEGGAGLPGRVGNGGEGGDVGGDRLGGGVTHRADDVTGEI